MKARIYKPTKTSMQSGVKNTKKWVFEYVQENSNDVDGLMGWVGSADTKNQVKLKFDSQAQAIEFAEKKGVAYELIEPKARKVKPKSYADNFGYKKVIL